MHNHRVKIEALQARAEIGCHARCPLGHIDERGEVSDAARCRLSQPATGNGAVQKPRDRVSVCGEAGDGDILPILDLPASSSEQ